MDTADETTNGPAPATGAGPPAAAQPGRGTAAPGAVPWPPAGPWAQGGTPGGSWPPPAAGWPAGQGGSWPPPGAYGQPMRMPSGLFPSGPPRPVYREPYPVQGGAVALGVVGGGLWMMLFGLLASSAGGYAWITILAGIAASGVAVLLARLGDRGAAVGVAMAVAVGLSIAAIVVGVRWAGGDWILW